MFSFIKSGQQREFPLVAQPELVASPSQPLLAKAGATGSVLQNTRRVAVVSPPQSSRFSQQRWSSWLPRVLPWYGVAPGPKYGAVHEPKSRRRLNVVALMQSIFLPWLQFALLTAALGFEIHYRRPWFVYMFCGIGFAVVAVVGFLALDASMKRRSGSSRGVERDATWFAFLFVTMAIAWLAAILLGDYIYHSRVLPAFDVQNLNSYVDVDPASMMGEQVMDGGRVLFTDNTVLDFPKSTGFRNGQTYCVAPITSETMGGRFDFWAVGVDCCSGAGGDFSCGQFNNHHAHGGLRLMDDDQRAYFRLAVQQAEASFGISAPHPLFFHWMQDPWQSVAHRRREALSWYLAGLSAFLAMQCFLAVAAALAAAAGREGAGGAWGDEIDDP